MTGTIGVSGMGRIGRLLVRRAFDTDENGMGLQAINSLYPAGTIAHLLKYDTIHGTWKADIREEGNDLIINGKRIRIVFERDPAAISWKDLGVDLAIDATGKFNDREGASRHLTAGASKVLITAPGKRMDLTVVMGVNDDRYNAKEHTLLSAASCTTNCVAPVLHVLDQAFQVKNGWMTTVHSYTNDQKHMDNPHSDLRRARACTQSIIPTSTGVGKALIDVLPHLAPHVNGISVRVPTPDVSLVDLTVQVKRPVQLEEVQAAFRQAAEGPMARYLGYSNEPLVSSDFIGCDQSAVIDGQSLMVAGDQIKVLAWYDNEWAYASRVMDLAKVVSETMKKESDEAWKEALV